MDSKNGNGYKMRQGLFAPRRCKQCKRPLLARYANEKVHLECREAWYRAYNRRYQRKMRRELKRSWEEINQDAAGA